MGDDYVLETMIGGALCFLFGLGAAYVYGWPGAIFCAVGLYLVLMAAYLHFSGY